MQGFLAFLFWMCFQRAWNSAAHEMSVEVAALEPSACLTLKVGESMNAQMTPVHSV